MIYAYLKTHVTNSAFFVANIDVYIYTIPKSFFTILFFLYWRGGGGGWCMLDIY